MHALRNLVRDAYPGDAFVFFCEHIFSLRFSRPFSDLPVLLDAGHCGQQPVTTDRKELDGLDECMSMFFFCFTSNV